MSETVRLQAVKQFGLLDLQLDAELQDLVAIASEICNTPIALITLLHEDNQWVKVSHGPIPENMPGNISFCTHAVLHNDLMIIPDALLDDRFKDSPIVTNGSKIRFYAGTPLTTRDGYNVGTLCVMDSVPHTLDKHQRLMLKILSRQAINIIELKLSYQQLEQSKLEAEEQRKTIKNAEIRLRAFFESSANLHVLLGKNAEVLDYNKAAYSFVKRVHGAKLTRGDLFITFLEPEFIFAFVEKFKIALEGKKTCAEGSTNYPEMGTIWWEAAFEPVWDNDEVIGVSYSVRNVTERKLYERKIVSQNQSLINIAYIQSHEYRGPLTSIMGMMNLIKEENYQAPVEYLQLLEIAINKLDEKIQEIVSHVNVNELKETTGLNFSTAQIHPKVTTNMLTNQ